MSIFFNNKKVVVLILVFFAALLTVSIFFSSEIYGEVKAANNMKGYLSKHNISFADVTVKDNTMQILMSSAGRGRYTLSDIKAKQTIYEALFANVADANEKVVTIVTYGGDGELIGEICVSNGMYLTEAAAKVKPSSSPIPIETVTADVIEGMDFSSLGVEGLGKADSSYNVGYKLLISVKNPECDILFSDLERLYMALEGYYLENGSYSQAEITVTDEKGECLYYVFSDFRYGVTTAYISEEMQKSFVEDMGPKA